ncbi:MAG TPA: GtrA family protein [Flavisolibacter sp.]|nr:GtrA family protein [Flavisolibacter sp.]
MDFFYPPFRKFMPRQTFRYAACGGGNTLLSLALYSISYNFIFQKEILHLGFVSFKPHIAALFFATVITFPIGFYLSLYVVFHGSEMKKRTQLFRYFLVVVGCVILNYAGLKLFVEVLHWYPTVSQILNTGIVVLFSYVSQRHFSFKSTSVIKRQI